MFDSVSNKLPRPLLILKRAGQLVVGTYLIIGAFATWRSYYQIHSLDLQTDSAVLRPDSTITTKLVSYARNKIDVRLELIQDNHSEIIASELVLSNEWALLDPRMRSSSQRVVVSQEVLDHFEAKPIRVRVTAIGRPQWGRTPPPVVRELVLDKH
ncbi:MAG TPA: hypothetical protein VJR02_05050 [Pyrinomonadaceae bacterium]|nr:hypothetical protein [Pyrinomonadaceae bacterium]